MGSLSPGAGAAVQQRRRLTAWGGLGLVVAYAVTGKLALLLALPPGYASAIFPPAGIAVAAALIAGRRSLGWIFIGSFLLNTWVGYSAVHALKGDVFESAAAIG